jgi:hypothetical protein
VISALIMGSPARRLLNPIARCWAKPHNRYAGTGDGRGTRPNLDPNRLMLMSVRWRERLGGATYACSVGCPLNDQALVRPLVTAAGETVFMRGSGGEVWLRPSDSGAVALAIATAPGWRVSPGLHVIPGGHQVGVTDAGRF